MFETIRAYINFLIGNINVLGGDLVENDLLLDKENLPSSKMDRMYMILLTGVSLPDRESMLTYTANVTIETVYLLTKKNYQTYDSGVDLSLRIVNSLKDRLIDNEWRGDRYTLTDLNNLSMSNTVIQNGNYLNSIITFELNVIDNGVDVLAENETTVIETNEQELIQTNG